MRFFLYNLFSNVSYIWTRVPLESTYDFRKYDLVSHMYVYIMNLEVIYLQEFYYCVHHDIYVLATAATHKRSHQWEAAIDVFANRVL